MKKVSFVLATVMLFNSALVWGQSTPKYDSSNLALKAELELSSNKKGDASLNGAANKSKKPTNPSTSKVNNEKKPTADKNKKPVPDKKEDQSENGLKLDKELVVPPPLPPKDEFPMEDILKMQNDKEVVISSFSAEEKKRVLDKFSRFIYANGFKDTFYKTMFKFLNAKDAKCESTFISSVIHELRNDRVERNEADVLDAFKYLRATGAIDDIMYDILEGLTKDYFALTSLDLKSKPVRNVFKDYEKKAEDYDLKAFFTEFTPMPDEVTKCGYREFTRLQNTVGLKSDTLKKRNSILRDLIFKAYEDGVLDITTTNILRFMVNSSTLNKRSIWLVDYVNTTIKAKNKLSPLKYKYQVVNLDEENKFSSERRSRFNKITRRKILYSKYDASQIILLAQVLKKTSQRMGVDPDTKTGVPVLIQEFQIMQENGQVENYVERIELDSQSQYNLARRLMRKDMVTLQMMTSFRSVKVTYDDVVMAALETGYLSVDDVAYVVKYDDLWNAEVSKSEKMLGFTFMVAGYSTFFLPPPWNVAGALALSIIEGVVDSKKIDGASNDNPNTFIE